MSGRLSGITALNSLERIKKQQCENSFSEFVRQCAPNVLPSEFVWGNHIGVICRHLEGVVAGDIKRLCVNIPPGCTKSTLISVMWPAWTWIKDPTAAFLCITYNQDLTVRDAVACRDLIGSDWYQSRWGKRVRVKFGEDSKIFYKLEGGGWRLSTTRGGRATGDHPKYVVVDDPLSAKQAKMAFERKGFDDWYKDTLSSRGISKDVRHVIAGQRFHPEDPHAAFLDENDNARMAGEALPWHHVFLPMRYDPKDVMEDRGYGADWRTEKGELLYPQLLDEEKVSRMERSMGSANAAAQLGQRPRRRDGEFFMMTRMKIIKKNELPQAFDAVCRFWDRAGVQDGGDYTAGALVGKKGDRFFLLHMIRVRKSSAEVEKLIEITMLLDEQTHGKEKVTTCFEIEGSSAGLRQADITIKRLRGHRVFGVRPNGNKEVHAETLQIAIENEEVCAVDGPWLPDVFSEMEVFPTVTNDDQTDAFAGAILELIHPTSKVKGLVIAEEGKGTDMAHKSKDGKCQNSACKRPAFSGNGYCCENCRKLADEGEVCTTHYAECNAKFNDWWMANSTD